MTCIYLSPLSAAFAVGYRCLGDGTFKTAKTLVPELLDACLTRTIRAFFRKSWQYQDAYQYVLFNQLLPC